MGFQKKGSFNSSAQLFVLGLHDQFTMPNFLEKFSRFIYFEPKLISYRTASNFAFLPNRNSRSSSFKHAYNLVGWLGSAQNFTTNFHPYHQLTQLFSLHFLLHDGFLGLISQMVHMCS